MRPLTLALLFLYGCSGSASPGVGDAPVSAATPDGVDSGEASGEVDAGQADSKVDAGAADPDSGVATVDAGENIDAAGSPDASTPPVDSGDLTCPGFTKYVVQPGKCLYLEDGTDVDGPAKCSPVYPLAGGIKHCAGLPNSGSSPEIWYLAGKNFITYATVNGNCPVQVTANCSIF